MAEKSTSYNEQTVSLGEQLRRAREAKKLTTEKVAAELRVKEEIIINLEAENWHQLYGRTYARGHFTNYVKYLDLPQSVLMVAFNIHYQTETAANGREVNLAIVPASKKSVRPFIIVCSIVAISFAALMLLMSENSEISSISPEIKRMSNLVEEK